MLLAGDLGGTKSLLAVFSNDGTLQREERFLSADFGSVNSMLQNFLADDMEQIEVASLGVAGPVRNNECQFTNLNWHFTSKDIQRLCKNAEVHLLNDLEAKIHAVTLSHIEQKMLRRGQYIEDGAIAVVAPGTGLGVGYGIKQGEHVYAQPCEAGHTDFAACTEEEEIVYKYLQRKTEHVSYEKICSGVGLINILKALTEHYQEQAPQQDTPNHDIVSAANNGNELCQRSVEVFCHVLARFCANVALNYLPIRGLFISGGFASLFTNFICSNDFLYWYDQKGRMNDLLADIPIILVKEPKLALLGAVEHAKKTLTKS